MTFFNPILDGSPSFVYTGAGDGYPAFNRRGYHHGFRRMSARRMNKKLREETPALTHRWLDRRSQRFGEAGPAMVIGSFRFPSSQGGTYATWAPGIL